MRASEILKGDVRAEFGSRAARTLRAEGRIPATLQAPGAPGSSERVDFSIDEAEFLTTRRHHTHLYDLEIGGRKESALVRELQWDTFGERLLHVEFKRVRRDEVTEAEVELEFLGHPKGGVINHLITHLTIRAKPGDIPDAIEIKVGHLEPGSAITAKDLELPPGVALGIPENTMIAVVVVPRGEEEAKPEAEGEVPPVAPGETPPAPEEES